eukprot:762617-Hanusia_phi.AAC.1
MRAGGAVYKGMLSGGAGGGGRAGGDERRSERRRRLFAASLHTQVDGSWQPTASHKLAPLRLPFRLLYSSSCPTPGEAEQGAASARERGGDKWVAGDPEVVFWSTPFRKYLLLSFSLLSFSLLSVSLLPSPLLSLLSVSLLSLPLLSLLLPAPASQEPGEDEVVGHEGVSQGQHEPAVLEKEEQVRHRPGLSQGPSVFSPLLSLLCRRLAPSSLPSQVQVLLREALGQDGPRGGVSAKLLGKSGVGR